MKIYLALILRYMKYKFIDTETIPDQRPERIVFGAVPSNKDNS